MLVRSSGSLKRNLVAVHTRTKRSDQCENCFDAEVKRKLNLFISISF